ncbi:hypothetical protein CR983_01595 [Candidatus Saccharibacteria bacterium]|nr:MAG: hypothetical protein CR983_01595 [Candidatus Saccharibacteria bacterium]
MATQRLTKRTAPPAVRKELDEDLLSKIRGIKATPLARAKEHYRPDRNASKDYIDSIEDRARRQQVRHRDTLLKIVGFLATASFILLTVIVLAQMIVRFFQPNYTGVSDAVVQIIAVSVFGQVLTVMGGLSYHLWKRHL